MSLRSKALHWSAWLIVLLAVAGVGFLGRRIAGSFVPPPPPVDPRAEQHAECLRLAADGGAVARWAEVQRACSVVRGYSPEAFAVYGIAANEAQCADIQTAVMGQLAQRDLVAARESLAQANRDCRERAPLQALAAELEGALAAVPAASGGLRLGGLDARAPRQTVTVGDVVVMGNLNKELVRAILKRNLNQIRYCYESTLVRFPRVKGTVTVKVVVAASGTVASSTVMSTNANEAGLESCVAGRVRTWLFPRPKGGGVVIVTAPFVFQPPQ